MKKATTIWGFVALGLCLQGQILKHEYTFANPRITGTGNIKTIDSDYCTNKGVYGQPSLPWRVCNLVLPEGTTVEQIVVTAIGTDTLTIDGIIAPTGHVRPLSVSQSAGPVVPDALTYSKSEFLGQDYSQLLHKVHYINGKPVLMFGLSPVKYNPAGGKLVFFRKLLVEVYGKQGQGQSRLCDHDIMLLKTFVDNAAVLPKAPQQTNSVNTIDVLLITTEQYVDALEPLLANYHSQGKKSRLVTTQSIQNSYPGTDLAEKIRNCIRDFHENKNVRFVVLGGDVETIPVRHLRAVAHSSQVYSENIPSDLYYAALDGNWDTNQNGIFGEPDEADLLPEVAIGRIPFSNASELNNFIGKTTNYTHSPVLSDTNKPLLVGEHLFDDPATWGAQYLDMIVGLQTANGYTTQGIPSTDPYDSLFDRSQTWTTNDLRNKVNQGTSFIHHVGHSNYDYNMRLYNSDLTNTFFSAINGITRLNPLIYSHGCLAAAFDQSDCVAERMIFLPNFASGYVGNSRYGWFNEGQTEGPSAHQHREFIHALYGLEKQQLGICHQISQLRTAAWVDLPFEYEPGAQRWVFYACNVLGDPVLPIWTTVPTSPAFETVGEIFAGDNELTITSSANNPNLQVSLLDKQSNLLGFVDSLMGERVLHIYPTIRVPDTLFLVSSGRNIIPDTVSVIFQRPTAPTLIFDGYTIGNGSVNYVVSGKPATIQINITNVGLTGTTQCTAVVSALTPGISVEGVQLNFGTVEAGQVVSSTESIEFSLPVSIPNNTNILFQIDILINNNIHHTDYFHIPVRASMLACGSAVWNDQIGGNGNGVPERGEAVLLTIPVRNFGGAESNTVYAVLTTDSQGFTVVNETIQRALVLPLQTTEFTFVIYVGPESSDGATLNVQANISDGIQSSSLSFSTRVNLPVEDFGASSFSLPVWSNNSASPWTFSPGGIDNGHCLRSGAISHSQSTQVSTTVTHEVPDKISFWVKTSCEGSGSMYPYDFLEFEVNGTRMAFWDNVPEWTKVTLNLPAGTNQLVWRYNKDGSVNAGQDAVWIDRIVFPPSFEIPESNNQVPVIGELTDINASANQNLNVSFTVSDPDNDAVNVTVMNYPEWISIMQNQEHWTILGTVPANPQPEYHFQVIASDGKQGAVRNVRILVSGSSGINIPGAGHEISVFPNPATNYCILSGFPAGQEGTIAFINSQGVCERLEKVVSTDEGKIVVEKFGNMARKGLYLLHYQFGTCKGTTVLLID